MSGSLFADRKRCAATVTVAVRGGLLNRRHDGTGRCEKTVDHASYGDRVPSWLIHSAVVEVGRRRVLVRWIEADGVDEILGAEELT